MTNNKYPNKVVTAGIDLGGTNTVIGLINEEGHCILQDHLQTTSYPEPQGFSDALVLKIQAMVEQSGTTLAGIGIGAPNGNFYSRSIENAPNLSWKGTIPLVDWMEEKFSIPIVLTNDANAAAVGEFLFGKAKGLKHFITVTIGTGLGSGIFVDGRLLYGSSGFAGELGHVTTIMGGRPCTCGKDGCLEAYVSARGLVQTAQEILLEENAQSILSAQPASELTPSNIYQAALKGDAVAIESFNRTGEFLGRAIADATSLFSPEAIFLFGGLSRAGDLLFNPTKAAFEKHVLPIFKGSARIEMTGLNEENAAILGAAALAWQKIPVL